MVQTSIQFNQKKKSQLDIVREELLRTGEISRNWCLQRFITRLGSRAFDLKKEGYNLITERRGGDYIYKLVK